MLWGLDMDGVVWLGPEAIPGSPEAIAFVKERGDEVIYVTNNSALTAQGYADKLIGLGIPTDASAIIHGGHAVAELLEPGQRALICAGAGVVEAVTERGAIAVSADEWEADETQPLDAVIMGWRPDFDYRLLSLAMRAVFAGAKLLAPSGDPLYPGAKNVSIGGGSLVAAIVYATGVTPIFAAKPYRPIADVIERRFGTVDVFVGDQPATDGVLAQMLGCAFYLVETGVALIARQVEVPTKAVLPNLAAVVDAHG